MAVSSVQLFIASSATRSTPAHGDGLFTTLAEVRLRVVTNGKAVCTTCQQYCGGGHAHITEARAVTRSHKHPAQNDVPHHHS